jgi:predicted  nucleic acid-binding Zn-ribbon protein
VSAESERRGSDAARAQAELKAAQLELGIAQERTRGLEGQLADCQDALEAARNLGASSQEAGEQAGRRVGELTERLHAAEEQARVAKVCEKLSIVCFVHIVIH